MILIPSTKRQTYSISVNDLHICISCSSGPSSPLTECLSCHRLFKSSDECLDNTENENHENKKKSSCIHYTIHYRLKVWGHLFFFCFLWFNLLFSLFVIEQFTHGESAEQMQPNKKITLFDIMLICLKHWNWGQHIKNSVNTTWEQNVWKYPSIKALSL